MHPSRTRLLPIAAAIALLAAAPTPTRALTLADLDAGASFGVGPLTFSDFSVTVAGALSVDLADYPVQLLGDGFRVAGPLVALLGGSGTLLMSYVVESTAPAPIQGASLFASLVAVGSGAAAVVSDSLFGPGAAPLGTLLAFGADGGGPPVFADAIAFPAVGRVEVVKVVTLTSGVLAAVPHADQRFFVVPEPLTLAMFAGGLAGLAFSGRRRAMVA